MARFARRGNARSIAETEDIFQIRRDINLYTGALSVDFRGICGKMWDICLSIICRFVAKCGTFVCRLSVDYLSISGQSVPASYSVSAGDLALSQRAKRAKKP